MNSEGQKPGDRRAPAGRTSRMPRAATALACLLRRGRSINEGKRCKSAVAGDPVERGHMPTTFPREPSFLDGHVHGHFAFQVSPDEREYSRATSSPAGLISESRLQDTGELKSTDKLEQKKRRFGVKELSLKKGRFFVTVPPLRPPAEKKLCWPFSKDRFPVSETEEDNGDHLHTSEISPLDPILQRALQHREMHESSESGGCEATVARRHEVKADADTSPSTVASASSYRIRNLFQSGGEPDCSARSFMENSNLAESEEQRDRYQYELRQGSKLLPYEYSEPRRAAAAGRLSPRKERPYEEKGRLCLNGEQSNALFAELGVAISCRKGLKRVPTNQDDFFAYTCDNWGLYGVFDGHGQGGHVVANFVQWHLPNVIHDLMSQTDNFKTALRLAFSRVDSMLREASVLQQFDSASSGSTASVVLHKRHENKLFVASVGDSTVVLARRDSQGQLVAHTVTRDHRPDDPTERSRIESFGGEIRRPVGHVPYRVFVKGKDYPGLAMSRSMGDFRGQSAGVTTEPDVLELDLTEGRDELVIMCTDGVWEFITPHEAVEILSRYTLPQAAEAVRALSCEAWKRWLEEDGHSVDDITVQLIHLFPPRLRTKQT